MLPIRTANIVLLLLTCAVARSCARRLGACGGLLCPRLRGRGGVGGMNCAVLAQLLGGAGRQCLREPEEAPGPTGRSVPVFCLAYSDFKESQVRIGQSVRKPRFDPRRPQLTHLVAIPKETCTAADRHVALLVRIGIAQIHFPMLINLRNLSGR